MTTATGQALTVRGPVAVDELGIASSHEHLISSQLVWFQEDAAERTGLARLPLTLETIGRVHRDPLCNLENLAIDDVDLVVSELSAFVARGGRTIVDLTNDGFGRDPAAIRHISETTGCHVVMGSGFYVAAAHPPGMDARSVESLAAEMIADVRIGVRGTGVRSGILGEIGCSPGIEPNERKVLVATALAQRETGAPIAIHQPIPLDAAGKPRGATEALTILDILEQAGADLSHTLMCHMDHSLQDQRYHKAVADRGCMLAFDRFGNEWHYDSMSLWREWRDSDRVQALKWLIDNGHEDQLVVGQDICYRINLTRYGGWGYAHLLEHVRPMMEAVGIDERVARKIFVDNPRRLLAFQRAIAGSGDAVAGVEGPG